MIVNDSAGLAEQCSICTLGPPPDMILRLPPPPMPSFLMRTSDYFISSTGRRGSADAERSGSGSEDGPPDPCQHTCEWRGEGVQYVEVPQQGTFFVDTWFIVLISAFVGIIFLGIILATFMYKCKLEPDVAHPNDDASQCSNRSNKNSTLSTSTASSGMQTTTTSGGPCSKLGLPRMQSEAVLYPCAQQQQQDALSDSRVMWATLTPRGTTRHYVEDHTYETIGTGGGAGDEPSTASSDGYCSEQSSRPPLPTLTTVDTLTTTSSRRSLGSLRHPAHNKRHFSEAGPNEHTYAEPPVSSPPVPTRPKTEKAFDNTAFVDYEDPHQMKNEYYQLEDVLEPCDPIFSVQGVYTMQPRNSSCSTLRPRVSSPTRIEHPNLPPLNLQPSLPRTKHSSRKNSFHSSHHNHHHHHHHHRHHQQHQQHQQQQPPAQQQSQQQQQHTPGDCPILRSGMTSSTTYIPTI